MEHLPYREGLRHLWAGDIDLSADVLKYALLTSAYTPADADEFFSSISGDEVSSSGTGYAAGGVTLAGVTLDILDDSVLPAWQPSQPYLIKDLVRPTVANGFIYEAVASGTSGASEPGWGITPNRETVDGGVVWLLAGDSMVRVDSTTDPTWDPSDISARWGVIYRDGTGGVDDYLLMYHDFQQVEQSQGDVFQIILPAQGFLAALRTL